MEKNTASFALHYVLLTEEYLGKNNCLADK